jgi:hypothetical protein
MATLWEGPVGQYAVLGGATVKTDMEQLNKSTGLVSVALLSAAEDYIDPLSNFYSLYCSYISVSKEPDIYSSFRVTGCIHLMPFVQSSALG